MLLAFVALGCVSTPEPAGPLAPPWFEEISRDVGIDFVHARADTVRFYFPEIMSGGAGWIDYDGDGWMDLYVVQGGAIGDAERNPYRNRLYRNVNGVRFEDVSAAAGVDDGGYGMGVAVGDYDNDGDDDLYVTNVGPNRLYRNEGDVRFIEVSETAGVAHAGWGSSAAFADYDADGWLDLYVVNYIDWAPEWELECTSGGAGRDYCHPDNYRAPAVDALYHNEGNGRFREVTRHAGIGTVRANGLGVVAADLNGDARLDFYVANDGDPNLFWINDGDGTFTDRALMTGSALNRQGMAEAGMGVVVFDLENDGDLDPFMTHLREETNTLYRNDGDLFQDITNVAGLASPSVPFTGFGTGAFDFDHDGFVDLYVANGRVGRAGMTDAADPFAEQNLLFRGTGAGTFEEVAPAGGTAEPLIATSRAAAFADYDNDGDVDAAVVNNGGRLHLLQNIVPKNGRWVGFDVRDVAGRPAIGARVAIHAGGRAHHRIVSPAGSYQASNDPRIHAGLGDAARVDSVVVLWPDGRRTRHGPLAVDTYHVLRPSVGT